MCYRSHPSGGQPPVIRNAFLSSLFGTSLLLGMGYRLRLLTIFVNFAALQLSLASGGPGCAMPSAPPLLPVTVMGTTSATGSVANTDGADLARDGEAAETPSDAPLAADANEPCTTSTTSTSCPTMAPCVFAAIAVTTRQSSPVAEPSHAVVLRMTMPRSVSLAPDVPPPRA